MKVLLKDGREVDLGADYISIFGEPGDGEHVFIKDVQAHALGCNFVADLCLLDAKDSYLLVERGSNRVHGDHDEHKQRSRIWSRRA